MKPKSKTNTRPHHSPRLVSTKDAIRKDSLADITNHFTSVFQQVIDQSSPKGTSILAIGKDFECSVRSGKNRILIRKI